jgi:hypothetical protein
MHGKSVYFKFCRKNNMQKMYKVGLRYSAIEGTEKISQKNRGSHYIKVRTILRLILKVFLLKDQKFFALNQGSHYI